MRFSLYATLRLWLSGWYSGRRIDISRYVVTAEKDEMPLHLKAQEFLMEFGSLKMAGCDFDPTDVPGDCMEELETILNTKITIIGEYNGSNPPCGILMAPNGMVYLDCIGTFYLLGETGDEAIECL